MADKSRRFELRLSEAEYARIQENMQEIGTRNMSAYLRKMALDGYCIQSQRRFPSAAPASA